MKLNDAHYALFEELGLPRDLDDHVRRLSVDEYIDLEERLVDEAVLHNRKDENSLTDKGELIIDIVSHMAEVS